MIYSYYHTSLDNLDFVNAENLNKTLDIYLKLVSKMDKNIVYENLKGHCEIMLNKYGLGGSMGGAFLPNDKLTQREIILWFLIYCDGKQSLYELSQMMGINIEELYSVTSLLEEKGIFEKMLLATKK